MNNRVKKFFEKCEKFGLTKLYDFSESIYINQRTKIEFVCKNCGKKIQQYPNNLFAGCGCKECIQKKNYKIVLNKQYKMQ